MLTSSFEQLVGGPLDGLVIQATKNNHFKPSDEIISLYEQVECTTYERRADGRLYHPSLNRLLIHGPDRNKRNS